MRVSRLIPSLIMGVTTIAITTSSVGAELQRRASDIIGANVVSAADEEIGTVDDLVIAGDNMVAAAILSVGGFLGIGDKLVAIPYADVSFVDESTIVVSVDREMLERLPAYEKGQLDLALERVEEAGDELRAVGIEKRAEYEARMEKTLAEWESKLADVKQDSKEVAADAETEVTNAWASVQEKWSEMKTASDDVWNDAQDAFATGVDRLENAWNALTNES